MKILFVCHGNICRSPMAQYMFCHIMALHGTADVYEVSSAGVSSEEEGHRVYPPAAAELRARGISFSPRHSARKLTLADYAYYDRIFALDHSNLRRLMSMTDGDPMGKIQLLTQAVGLPGEIEDPYYYGGFSGVADAIYSACEKLYFSLTKT